MDKKLIFATVCWTEASSDFSAASASKSCSENLGTGFAASQWRANFFNKIAKVEYLSLKGKLVNNILTEHVRPVEKNWEDLTPLAIPVLGDKIVSTGLCRGLWSSFEHFWLSAYPLCKNWNKIQNETFLVIFKHFIFLKTYSALWLPLKLTKMPT